MKDSPKMLFFIVVVLIFDLIAFQNYSTVHQPQLVPNLFSIRFFVQLFFCSVSFAIVSMKLIRRKNKTES